jgi:hypothetical protein
MKFVNDVIVDAESVAITFESDAVLLDQIYGFSFHAIISGSPNGSIKLQASNDPVRNGDDVANWIDVANSSQSVTVAGQFFWNVDASFYKWVRVVYTAVSGSGSCTVNYSAKG